MNGILLINKPSGWTSFDVVAKVRGIIRHAESESSFAKASEGLRPRKRPRVGHAGTLDPLATGLLVILIGDYCKRAAEFSKLDKIYDVTMTLGQTSTTGDEEGQKTLVSTDEPSEILIFKTIAHFTGMVEQVPPIYSAIKVNGQRAYALARAGKEVKLEPRQVTIYSSIVTNYAYPCVKFTTKVSSGTYIRSLVQDMGSHLATGAYMSALTRTQIGNFNLKNAHTMDQIGEKSLENYLITVE